ncbi:MAG TPA: hypothetical protein VHZ26_05045 [Caulobacteraceae bacterium]|nr:hypothetical protein [Caulobacteraceae bacterium]
MKRPNLDNLRIGLIAASLSAIGRTLLAAAMLMWPLLVATRPTEFFDTGQYWWRGRMIVVDALGLDRDAPSPYHQRIGPMPVVHGFVQTQASIPSYIGARSPTFSIFVFLTQQLGTLWLTAAVEALATAAIFYIVWRAAVPKAARWTYLALMAVLAALTSLAFFASFAMPDVFAGLGVLIMVALVLHWDRLGRQTRLGLLGLLAVSLSFASSHLLLAILLLPVAALLLRRLGASWRTTLVRTAALVAAIGAAGLCAILIDNSAHALTGIETGAPPFLTARLLADGPGRTYLRRACARQSPYFLCRFKALPLDNSQDILWSQQSDSSVFTVSSVPDRFKLEAEQGRFVRDVILADPLGVAWAALRDFTQQLGLFAVIEPLRDPCAMKPTERWSGDFLHVLIVDADRCGPGQTPLMPRRLLLGLHSVVLMLSAYALWRLAHARRTPPGLRSGGPDALDDVDRLLAATSLTVAAIVLNAAICGALSGPFPRYEARLIWLLPTLVLLAGSSLAEPALARVRGSLSRTAPAKSAMG